MSRIQNPYFIFPLTNVNLFPRTTKPLHIFEPRYIQMIDQSIQKTIPIALCFRPEGTDEIRPIAGYAIPRIVESRADLTTLVFMSGSGKVKLDVPNFRLVDGLLMGDGEVVDEDILPNEKLKPKYEALSEALIRWIRQHIQDQQQREIFIRGLTGPQEVIGAFAAYLIFDYDLQYEMMEIFSINDQITFLYRLLESGKLTNV
ncbi:MAG: LON peptidase substrate-binding domain-containing protein [Bdellovibrionaceae bacterium]|nr:LON peptidase substrate-binding domain-containing protein [Bdellovibrio sp.]